MLSNLQITDFAIVRNIDLDFNANMTVITGETGAGKSILLDAINLCLGERADSNMIRPGCQKAEISATFDISSLPGAILWLTDCDLGCNDMPQECIIRRVLMANGRSKAYINGKIATSAQLKLLGEHLIQIHGQHQHQSLIKSFEQLRLLDAFGGHSNLLSQVQKAHKEWHKIHQEYKALKNNLHKDDNRLELLRYQVAELIDIDPKQNELDSLHQEQQVLNHAQDDFNCINNLLIQLSEDEQMNLMSVLQKTQEQIKPLLERHPSLANTKEILNSLEAGLQEAITEINHASQAIDLDPEKLQIVEQRLSTLYDIARKHKVQPEQLHEHFIKLNEELDNLNNADERCLALEASLIEAKDYYLQAAQKLSTSREKAAKKLAKEIGKWLEPLGMPGGQFGINLKPIEGELSLSGLETAEYCVSANPGHPLQPIHKVASGGELSRISLAIQLIVANYLNTPTLIFDEVDVGVGGKIGAIIGQALQQLGESVQVLCVTHLPQVAGCGTQHIRVEKHRSKKDTHTSIQVLSEEERVEELARMLGGMDITDQARAHAKGLLSTTS